MEQQAETIEVGGAIFEKAELDKEGEEKLLTFLNKVSKAVEGDKSMPSAIGEVMNAWAKELVAKGIEPAYQEKD